MFLQNELLTRLLDELVADDSSGGFRDCRSYLGEAVRMHLPDRRNQVIRTACPNCSVGLLFARCQLSPNVLATYTRFAWLTGAVLARLVMMIMMLLVMMIMMVLVMMMNVQLRDPNFEAEIWPRKRRTPRANVRSR